MISFVVGLFFLGMVAGYVARFLVPGPDPMTFLGTIALGVVGSFAGGFLGYVIFDIDTADGPVQRASFVGSVLGAMVVLIIYNALSRRATSE